MFRVWIKIGTEWQPAKFLIGSDWESSIKSFAEGYAKRLNEDGFEAKVSGKRP